MCASGQSIAQCLPTPVSRPKHSNNPGYHSSHLPLFLATSAQLLAVGSGGTAPLTPSTCACTIRGDDITLPLSTGLNTPLPLTTLPASPPPTTIPLLPLTTLTPLTPLTTLSLLLILSISR